MLANPRDTIAEVKRIMGGEQLPDGRIVPKTVRLGGQEFSAQEISAMILKQLKTVAEEKIGSPIHDAVITVPAYFHENQRKATEDAARIAQLNPRLLINEPTAAATAYGLSIPASERAQERILIVYDLGGGTFDVSVIRMEAETIEVMGTSGDDHLGGGDFDELLTDWAFDQLEREHPGSGGLRHSELRGRVKAAAEQAKIDLSGADFAVLEVPNFTPDINVYCEIDRDTFISLLRAPRLRPRREKPIGLLDETLESVEEALRSARRNFREKYDRENLTMDDMDEFLLVGGSTRIPAIKEMLEARFNRPVRFDSDIVDKAVSLGAAIVARDYIPSSGFEEPIIEIPTTVSPGRTTPESTIVPTLIDVTGHSLGVAVVGNRFHRLIMKDSDVPAMVTHRDFTTVEDGALVAAIRVFQGEDPIADQNTFLGEIVIDGLEPRPVGFHLFDITFSMNQSGVLNVEAIHRVRDNSRPPISRKITLTGEVEHLPPEEVTLRRDRIGVLTTQGFVDYEQPVYTDTPPAGYQAPPPPPSTPVFDQRPPGPSSPPPASGDEMEARVPPGFREVWQRARQQATTLQGAERMILEKAVEVFEDAVREGDQAKITDSGNAMMRTAFLMQG
jgi:molecular chaperone DnaK